MYIYIYRERERCMGMYTPNRSHAEEDWCSSKLIGARTTLNISIVVIQVLAK